MKIRIFTFAIAALFCFNTQLSAQKLKSKNFSVAYTQLPAKPLDNEFTTYKLNVYGSAYINGHSLFESGKLTRASVEKNINLAGFKKVTGNAHVRVNISVGTARTVKNEIEKKVTTSKTKDGKETKTTSYFMVYQFYIPVSFKVYDYEGNKLFEAAITDANSLSRIQGSSYSSRSRAYEDWKNKRFKTINNRGVSYVQEAISSVNRSLNYQFGYPAKKGTDLIKVTKKVEEAAFMDAYNVTKAAFEKVKADAPIETLSEDLQPAIDFWMGYKKYSAKDKKQKKLRYACLHNLAIVYFWMEDLDNAEKYAKECLAIEWKEGPLNRHLTSIKNLRKSFETNKVNTRHLAIDVESATPPSDNVAVAAPTEDKDNASMSGSVVLANGEKVEGDFIVNTTDGKDIVFGPKGNIIFNYVAGVKKVSSTLNPTEVQEFSFNGRNFKVMDFTPGAKGNKTSGKHILEVVYDSPRIQLFKYFPYDDQLGDKKIEFALMKSGIPSPTSTSSTDFLLFKKGLSKYFEDCADLSEIAAAGDIDHTEEGLIQAARIYAEVCEVRP